MTRYLDTQDKHDIRKAIDHHEWKHSWHLPKAENGYVNWNDDATIAECLTILDRYRSQALKFAGECDRLVNLLSGIQKNRAALEEDAV